MHVHQLVVDAQNQVCEIEPTAVADNLAGYLVVDVREPEEALHGFLPGAINIPRGVLEFRVCEDLRFQQRSRDILVYSGKGDRSTLAALTLMRLGFSNVQSLAGGMRRWSDEDRLIN